MSKQGFELRQSTGLAMTTQMQQSMKLLHMTNIELNQYIEQSMLSNPFLEVGGEEKDNQKTQETLLKEVSFDNPAIAVKDLDTDYSNIDPEATKFDLSQSENNFENATDLGNSIIEIKSEYEGDKFENLSQTETLKMHLTEQVAKTGKDSLTQMILLFLIDNIDPSGYLFTPIEEIAKNINIAQSKLERILQIAQGFSPTGVFARNVSECLELQLKEKNLYDKVFAMILKEIKMLANYDLTKLANFCGINQESLHKRIKTIKSLTAKPGSAFYYSPSTMAIPDVIVTQNPDWSWNINLNSEVLPKVLINKSFYKLVKHENKANKSKATNDKSMAKNIIEKSFISEQLTQANWLVNAMEQRANTILKVATEIIKQQDEFLTHGLSHMQPMKLQDVADLLEIHPSTVSRVTANKFMQTPRGVIEMKFFFSAALKSKENDNDTISSTAIKEKIRILIHNESKDNILSDEKIVTYLCEDNISIKRRTIAKYRSQLKIPSSSTRKKLYKFAS